MSIMTIMMTMVMRDNGSNDDDDKCIGEEEGKACLSAGKTGKPLNLVLRNVFTTVSIFSTALKPTTGLFITCMHTPQSDCLWHLKVPRELCCGPSPLCPPFTPRPPPPGPFSDTSPTPSHVQSQRFAQATCMQMNVLPATKPTSCNVRQLSVSHLVCGFKERGGSCTGSLPACTEAAKQSKLP